MFLYGGTSRRSTDGIYGCTRCNNFFRNCQVDRLKAVRLKVLSGYFGYEGRKLWGIRRRRIMRVSSTSGLPHGQGECSR